MNVEVKPARPRRERTENAARRRRQIIEATIDSVVLHGLSGTTLATVAAQAGLSQGSAIFYFKTKEDLFAATLNAHYEDYGRAWKQVYEARSGDAVIDLTRFVLVDLSEAICNRRNLTLWHAFWGEVGSRPRFAEIAALHDSDRLDHLQRLVGEADSELRSELWSAESFSNAVDALTDGLWMELHINRGHLTPAEARRIVCRFIASAFPGHCARVLEMAEADDGGR